MVLLATLATSHVLQSNKNKTYRGRGKPLSVSIKKSYCIASNNVLPNSTSVQWISPLPFMANVKNATLEKFENDTFSAFYRQRRRRRFRYFCRLRRSWRRPNVSCFRRRHGKIFRIFSSEIERILSGLNRFWRGFKYQKLQVKEPNRVPKLQASIKYYYH